MKEFLPKGFHLLNPGWILKVPIILPMDWCTLSTIVLAYGFPVLIGSYGILLSLAIIDLNLDPEYTNPEEEQNPKLRAIKSVQGNKKKKKKEKKRQKRKAN